MSEINEITDKECVELIKEYRNGDNKAGEMVFIKNYYLVENVASNRLHNSKYEYAFLLRLGRQGLLDAIRNFDLSSNSFRHFAILCISNRIDNFLKMNPIPTIPSYSNDIIKNIVTTLNLKADSKDYLEIRYIIELLPTKVKKCVVLKYGENKSEKEISDMVSASITSVNDALNKVSDILIKKFLVAEIKTETSSKKDIKPILSKNNCGRQGKLITKWFPNTPISEIKAAIEKLPNAEYKEITYAMFGQNLDTYNSKVSKTDKQKFHSTIKKYIGLILEGKELPKRGIYKKKRQGKLITEWFPNTPISEIKAAIEKLPNAEERKITYEIYGENLDIFNSTKDVKRFHNTIKPKIKKMLNKNRMNSFYEEIDLHKSSVGLFTADEIAYLKNKYKTNVDAPINVPISPDFSYRLIVPKTLTKVSEESQVKLGFDSIANLIKNILSNYSSFSKEELLVFIFRISLIEQKDVNIEQICKYFGLTEDEINDITIRILNTVKVDFDSIYDTIMKCLYPRDNKNNVFEIKPIND